MRRAYARGAAVRTWGRCPIVLPRYPASTPQAPTAARRPPPSATVTPSLSRIVRHVVLRRLAADVEGVGDLRVGEAGGHQLEHLHFVAAESVGHLLRPARRWASVRAHAAGPQVGPPSPSAIGAAPSRLNVACASRIERSSPAAGQHVGGLVRTAHAPEAGGGCRGGRRRASERTARRASRRRGRQPSGASQPHAELPRGDARGGSARPASSTSSSSSTCVSIDPSSDAGLRARHRDRPQSL